MSKNEKGFGVVEVILVLVILGIIGFTGWRVYEANREVSQMPVDNSTVEKKPVSTLPEGYKLYENTQYKFRFAYPDKWIDKKVDENKDAWQTGTVVAFVSPEQDKISKDFVASGRQTEGPASSSVVVNRWSNINDFDAKGGEWTGQKRYANLADYFNDPYDGRPKQKINEVAIDGQKAYEVILGGIGQCYGVMLERNDSVYQISFPTITEKKDLTPEARQIIDSFKFN